MAREIIWTESAWRDLESIVHHIARDSKHYAAGILFEARDAARSLIEMAGRGRRVPEFNKRNTRELLLGNYRLIYRTSLRKVYILAFIHGARDLRGVWKRNLRLIKND